MRQRQWVQTLLFLLFGIYFLDMTISGQIYFYTGARFGWVAWFGTVLILVLALVNTIELLRRQSDEITADNLPNETNQEVPHGVKTLSWFELLLLTIPLVIALLSPQNSQSIGADSGAFQSLNNPQPPVIIRELPHLPDE